MIRFDAVSKNYPNGTTAVDGLSLELAEGGLTVLVGPSGCGKTTTLRMVNRMVEPSAGTVSLRGQDIREVAAPELRRGIGYVIQHAGLFPHRTILDNVATVPLLLGWGKKKARSRAAELLDLVGLPATMAKRYPYQLSGGQQQRVGVARALGADPPVLLMDEPFSAVDPIVRAELQAEFLRLQKELHKTIVFVTHDIDEAIKLGDHIAVFRTGGRLAQFDTPERLLEHPADDFVADFVGQDRGIRRLSFVQASGLPLREGPVLPVTASVAATRALGEPWVLAVDAARRPLGWAATADLPPGGTLADATLAPLGHTFSLTGDSARAALDAALLSPSHLAVGVDAQGAVAGVADAYELSAAMARASTVTGASAKTPVAGGTLPQAHVGADATAGGPATADAQDETDARNETNARTEAGKTPEAPETPETGKVPGAGKALGVGKAFDVGEASGAGKAFDVGEAPGAGEASEGGKVPGAGKALGVGEASGAGEASEVGKVPGAGEALGVGEASRAPVAVGAGATAEDSPATGAQRETNARTDAGETPKTPEASEVGKATGAGEASAADEGRSSSGDPGTGGAGGEKR